MAVVGKHTTIIEFTGKTVDVNAFSPDCNALQEVPIVDAMVKWSNPYRDDDHYLLLIKNALYVPSMENNLIPPFIMREAGIVVNDVPKIHVEDPQVEHHSLYFKKENVRIPLSLNGVFSYFPTSKPTEEDLEQCENILLLTPNGPWNPHCDAYAHNEESMVDFEGNMIEKQHRKQILLSEIEEDPTFCTDYSISKVEAVTMDNHFEQRDMVMPIAVNKAIDPLDLSAMIVSKGIDAQFMATVGATRPRMKPYLFDDVTVTATDTSDEESNSDSDSDSNGNENDDLETLRSENTTIDPEDEEQLDAFMASATHGGKPKGISPETLSKVWRIDLETAKRTIDVTSQNCMRTSNPNFTRNYSTNDRMLRYKRINQYFFMDTFFATSKGGKSTRGHTCVQLFVTDKGFIHVIPMRRKSEVLQALKQFAKEIGAPDAIICDAAGEQTSSDLRQFCNDMGTTLRVLEEGTPWANKAELYIGLMKEAVRKDMKESGSPIPLWDYCVERRARINNLLAKDLFQLHGQNAHFTVTGEEGDISNLCQFGWYDWCYFREKKAKFPFNQEILGRVLGPATGAGNEMCQWILKANGRVVPRRTCRPLTTSELHSEVEKKKRQVFDDLIEGRLGSPINPPRQNVKAVKSDYDSEDDFIEYEDDEEEPQTTPEIDEAVDSQGKAIYLNPPYDTMINAEILLHHNDKMQTGRVTQRAIGPDGVPVGRYDQNPRLNSLVYEVEFPDGQVKEYAANVLAENMLSQIDSEGFSTTLFDGIVDYRKDETAVDKADRFLVTKRGRRKLRQTTVGWKLLVAWKDGSETWIPLKDLKESNPVEVAEFARARGIEDEPAFAWWVPYTLRKRDIIISKVKARIRKTTHKYGIEVPRSVEHAKELDIKNKNSLWQDAIDKEMHNIGVAFQILENDEHVPVGWKKATGHMIFDVKMDFTRKARWVLDGHKCADPEGSTYAGVVSRESVRIALTYAALNDLEVYAADIRNAYLQAPSSQKDYIICGPEFGIENIGKKALIRRALYGGKAAGRDFRNHLRHCMRHLGFTSCLADPDVWMRPAIKSDGTEYYEYVLLYTDDTLVISENAEAILRNELGKYFELKQESIGPPKIYLGGHMRKVTLENGAKAWAFGSSQYVRNAVSNVEKQIETRGWKLPRANTPISTSYRPELDVSTELNNSDASYYQSLIGILRWMVELGRIDICLETSMMSSHLALPREGHLQQVLHIFGYLKKYHNAELVFDPSDPVIDEALFERRDWASSEFGDHLTEEIPSNMPQPRGMGFVMSAMVDADHAADTTTRRSRTGFLVYLNNAPIYWMSKKQASIESSSFGSEFTAMKQCTEYIRGLRYKLRMMGIPINGPAFVYGDNQSVLANTTIPDSTLKKKSQSIAYHFVREGVARDEWRTAYVNTHENPADLLTKPLPAGEKRHTFVKMIMYHIFETGD